MTLTIKFRLVELVRNEDHFMDCSFRAPDFKVWITWRKRAMPAGDDCGGNSFRKSMPIRTETPATFSTTLWELGRDLPPMETIVKRMIVNYMSPEALIFRCGA
jgi:hypothetical protein